MRIDQEDIPDYIRARQRSPGSKLLSALKWSIAGLVGIGITAGAIYFTDGNLAQLAQSIRINGQPIFSEAPPSPPVTTQDDYDAQVARALEASKAQSTPESRQTEFNDANYRPKNPINIMSTEGLRQSNAYQKRPEQQAKASYPKIENVSVDIKSWDGGTWYRTKWTAINNYIDGGTVCSNFKRGSINFRECRKGAKQYFHEQCRIWRDRYDNDSSDQSYRMKQRYCSAASSFSPMG